jgi:hypothetical protein
MNARVRPATAVSVAPPAQADCATCATYERSICLAAAWSLPSDTSFQVRQSAHTVAARRIICREQELQDVVPVICEGWAASVVMLSDGSRQILSFLLPGDIVSAALFFDVRPHCLVEAVTDVSYRSLKRAEFRAALFKHPALFERLLKAWTEETLRADQLIVDLGRRTADGGREDCSADPQSCGTARRAWHGPVRDDGNGFSPAPAPHRRRYGANPSPCQQSADRVSPQRLDQHQRSVIDGSRPGGIPAHRPDAIVKSRQYA